MSTGSSQSQPLSETARERETFKYDDLGLSTAALRTATPETPFKSIPTSALSLTPDPAITAFAQLGLYRLNTLRCLVSLFDRTYQHFVADAARSEPLCLYHDSQPSADGHPTLSYGAAIPRTTSICEHVLMGASECTSSNRPAHGYAPANDLPVSVVPDLDCDPRFCHIQDKKGRFYAGVPIRSPAGINIGVYCVLDDKPRPDGVTADQLQFLRDISKTIMHYLEAKRSDEWYRREERMVRGLGSFVDGHATLSDWSDSPNRSCFHDLPGVQEGVLNKKLQAGPRSPLFARPKSPFEPSETASTKTRTPVLAVGSRPIPQAAVSASHFTGADQLQGDVERVFSKAANVIRESIEVEGVLFLDASVRSFGGLIGKEVSEPPILIKPSSSESSSDESTSTALGNTKPHTCKLLGFSTSSHSSINGDEPHHEHTTMPEKLLRSLLHRHPHGCIFNFEPDAAVFGTDSDIDSCFLSPSAFSGSCPAPDVMDSGTSRTPQEIRKRRDAVASLGKMFAGARSVAFVPLFDGQKSRWSAGGFVWTKTPTRIFTSRNELSYLRVFGLTTMAEVARLNNKAADSTKTDILGSISHELRSPLHGVVGAVDLLRNTDLDSAQEQIVHTIETSGRTLLDTIDHLLEYSRISTHIRTSKAGRKNNTANSRSRSRSPSMQTISTTDIDVQLCQLVEEAVESVLAGWSYRNMSDAHFAAWNSFRQGNKSAKSREQGRAGSVQTYLDIDPEVSWSFRIHPGAFRRIVMNLVGNSLKFTSSGFIRITLSQERDRNSQLGSDDGATVVLTVSDSGKGIGQDYLRRHLFMPFSQEDQFARGTGLGLCLVRQMATSLGGGVNVSSQKGHGTTVTVVLPLPRNEEAERGQLTFQQTYQSLAGCRVQLRGFDTGVVVRDGFRREDSKQMSQLGVVQRICEKWLGMRVVLKTDEKPLGPTDFVIWHNDDANSATKPDPPVCPHVYVRQDSNTIYDADMPNQDNPWTLFACLTQPIGPRKLADALLASRARYQEVADATTAASRTETPKKSSLFQACPPNGGDSENDHLSDSPPLKRSTSVPNLHLRRPSLQEAPSMLAKCEVLIPAELPNLSCSSTTPVIVSGLDGRAGTVLKPVDRPRHGDDIRWVFCSEECANKSKVLTAYMEKLKQPHTTAVNGLEAMETFTKSPSEYSCILTDISMPIMDGLESTRRIREFERTNKLKPTVVIALTGLSGSDIQQDAFVSGVDMFLTRPLVLKTLVKALE
ncbi:hsp90-like protein, partial [Lasiosphaeria ovina]